MGLRAFEATREDGFVVIVVYSPPERVGTSLVEGTLATADGDPVYRISQGVYEVSPDFGSPYRVTSRDPSAP